MNAKHLHRKNSLYLSFCQLLRTETAPHKGVPSLTSTSTAHCFSQTKHVPTKMMTFLPNLRDSHDVVA